MQFWHKFGSSQQKPINDFTHFKLIISKIIKIVEFFIFNLLCLAFLTLEFSFSVILLQLTQ